MVVFPLLAAAFSRSAQVREFIKDGVEAYRAQSDENARYNLARKVLGYLNGYERAINVDAVRGSHDGNKDTELQVTIGYSVKHPDRENYTEQYKSFCLGFGSWKELERDIKTLASNYHDIYGKVFGFEPVESEEFWDDFTKFQRFARKKAEEATIGSTRQP